MTSLTATAVPATDRTPPDKASRRAPICAGVGAIIGLLIAGFGLFTAQGTRFGGVPAEDAAVVNGVPVPMVDFVAQLRTLYDKSLSEATRKEKAQALDDMIREELYVQRGVELGMASDDTDVRAALARAGMSQVAADAMATTPTERQLRAWFDAHRAAYAIDGTIDAVDYVLPRPARQGGGAALADALRVGAAPTTLGFREADTFADGSQFLAIARRRLGDGLYAQALRLPEGGVSSPVAKSDGIHVLVLRHRRAPTRETFDEARPKVTEDWIADAVARTSQQDDQLLRARADVKIAKAL